MNHDAWKGQRIVDQPDFRTYQPEWVAAGNGEEVLLQLCEELDPESLRWEPFYATLARRQKPQEQRNQQ
ncbi:MAG: hypothetical protein KIT09_30455 [Bryobacteraceae bacterium]|nr:hypothetical protein [Bryobacteraceae bacterium]